MGVRVYSTQHVQCTLYTVHCTLYTVHCTLYTKHCTLYSMYIISSSFVALLTRLLYESCCHSPYISYQLEAPQLKQMFLDSSVHLAFRLMYG